MVTKRLQEPNRAPSAKPLGRAKLPDKRFVCNKKGRDYSGKANLVVDTGHIVWGVLYEIDSADLNNLNRYEGDYKIKEMIVIDDQATQVKAYTYISEKLTEDPRAYECYKKIVIKGAREHNLPDDYIKNDLETIKTKLGPN
jgi:gamma-glutamylcyclotransferase (GGCT)/AIG2-like uncharacterized protein YtfP|tara:strand:+ start:427 stop:849 length:423 start_codon:yes stop_codon:yes gene_type:complete